MRSLSRMAQRICAMVVLAVSLGGCCHNVEKPAAAGGGEQGRLPQELGGEALVCTGPEGEIREQRRLPQLPQPRPELAVEIEDLRRLPQNLGGLARSAERSLSAEKSCGNRLLADFQRRFFTPWTSPLPIFENAETVDFMKKEAKQEWYGVNKRRVAREPLQKILDNCNLKGFPSRNDKAIAVAPGHLRGLPTPLPLYERGEGAPFDMLSYPQVKLNEPLRVLHVSRDGAWYFVETGYTNGWLERRDVAFVDAPFVEQWMLAPHLVITRDQASVSDGKGVATFTSKIGTVLPIDCTGDGWWDVQVASAGEGGMVECRKTRIGRDAAAPFPIEFTPANIALIGDQLLGQPYGWGEQYDLRDCSALLRDFFLPFGIWLPRTSADQIASIPRPVELARLQADAKADVIRKEALPFLTLLYKPGHIMLYAGVDSDGRPLVFHDAWSIRLKDENRGRTQVLGLAAVTTMEPGKELGLVPGASLLERVTEMATITDRCPPAPKLSLRPAAGTGALRSP